MNLQKIKELCINRPGGLRKLAADIKMSETNLHRCINNNKIQAHDLEKVANCLGVPVSVFFSDPIHIEAHGNSQAAGRDINNIGVDRQELVRLQDAITHLEQRIADKDAIIADKDKLIDLYENRH